MLPGMNRIWKAMKPKHGPMSQDALQKTRIGIAASAIQVGGKAACQAGAALARGLARVAKATGKGILWLDSKPGVPRLGYGWTSLMVGVATAATLGLEPPLHTSPESMAIQEQALKGGSPFPGFREAQRKLVQSPVDVAFHRMVRSAHRRKQPEASVEERNNLLMDAIAFAESKGDLDAISRSGARGAYQIMPSTAPKLAIESLHCPVKSRQAAKAIVQDKARYAHRQAQGDLIATLFAYNAGQNHRDYKEWVQNRTGRPLEDMQSIPLRETRRYVTEVLTAYMTLAEIRGQEDYVGDQLQRNRLIHSRDLIPPRPRRGVQIAAQI